MLFYINRYTALRLLFIFPLEWNSDPLERHRQYSWHKYWADPRFPPSNFAYLYFVFFNLAMSEPFHPSLIYCGVLTILLLNSDIYHSILLFSKEVCADHPFSSILLGSLPITTLSKVRDDLK